MQPTKTDLYDKHRSLRWFEHCDNRCHHNIRRPTKFLRLLGRKIVSAATNWVHRLVAVRQKSEHWAQVCLNSDQWVHPQKSIYGISRFLQWFEQRMWQSLYELHSEPPRVQLVAKTTYFFHWQTASQVLQLIGLYFHFLGARCHSLRKTISPCWRDHWIFFGCITAEKE